MKTQTVGFVLAAALSAVATLASAAPKSNVGTLRTAPLPQATVPGKIHAYPTPIATITPHAHFSPPALPAAPPKQTTTACYSFGPTP